MNKNKFKIHDQVRFIGHSNSLKTGSIGIIKKKIPKTICYIAEFNQNCIDHTRYNDSLNCNEWLVLDIELEYAENGIERAKKIAKKMNM